MNRELIEKIIKFRDDRNWKQFHNPKDLALSLVLESTELLELFQWKSDDDSKNLIINNKKEVSLELADIYYWLLLISHDFGIDLDSALENKLKQNEEKYPIDKSFGVSTKYDKL
jgi:NTP pyrophosphatase (non-canonical NTP hydrolase)